MVTSRKPGSVGSQFTVAAVWALEAGLLIPFVEKRGWKFSKFTENGGSEVRKRFLPANRNRFERRQSDFRNRNFAANEISFPPSSQFRTRNFNFNLVLIP
jgi:hypothetical protein